jgi:hypothetical protein
LRNRVVLGSCIKYDDQTVYVRAETQEEYDFLLQFFAGMGMAFVREQHGKGPVHQSCKVQSSVFEIYPPKKKK